MSLPHARHGFRLALTKAGILELDAIGDSLPPSPHMPKGHLALIAPQDQVIRVLGAPRRASASHAWQQEQGGTSLSMLAVPDERGGTQLTLEAKRQGTALRVELSAANGTVIGQNRARIFADFAPIVFRVIDDLTELTGTLDVPVDSQERALTDSAKADAADDAWIAYRDGTVRGELELGAVFAASSPLEGVVRELHRFAETDFNLFISGEQGTGKTHLVRAIHSRSRRPGQLVAVNAADYSGDPNFARAFLLGCVKDGPFRKEFPNGNIGLVEAAAHGTLFLDEFYSLDPGLQASLLTAFEPGQTPEIATADHRRRYRNSARLIAASSTPLANLLRDGTLNRGWGRRFWRTPFELPRFADRLEDIPALLNHFIPRVRLQEDLFKSLFFLPWPNNVSEFQQVCMSLAGNAEPALRDLSGRLANDCRSAWQRYEAARAVPLNVSQIRQIDSIVDIAAQVFDQSSSTTVSSALELVAQALGRTANIKPLFEMLEDSLGDTRAARRMVRAIFLRLQTDGVVFSSKRETVRYERFDAFFGHSYKSVSRP